MKKSVVVLIVILATLVLGMGGYLVYDKVLSKDKVEGEKVEEKSTVDNKTTNDSTEQKSTSNESTYVSEAYNKRTSWKFPDSLGPDASEKNLDIVNQAVLPKINIDTDNANQFNRKIMEESKSITDVIDKGTYISDKLSVTACHVNYDYSVNDNIIFILVTESCSNYRGSGNTAHSGYYYDITNDKELSVQDICNKYNITINDINEKIKLENENRNSLDESNASHILEVTGYNQITVMTIANIKSFDVYVETSREPYVAYIYKP